MTGLRAIAAFMIVAIHTGAFRDFGLLGNNLTDNGKYGVHIFFVISGYAVAANFIELRSFKAFIIRRFFRVAPLYYVATSLMFVAILFAWVHVPYWMERYGSAPDIYNAFMHISFLSAWDVRVANSLIGTEWTIPIEIFWYLFLPLLMPYSLERAHIIRVFVVLILLAAATAGLAEWLLPSSASHFMPTTYGVFFFLGVVCHNLREQADRWSADRRRAWCRSGLLGLAVVLLLPSNILSPVLVALATSAILVGYTPKHQKFRVLTAGPMLFLGSISYSIYLWHMIVIIFLRLWIPEAMIANGFVWFVFVGCVTIVVSALSYRFIERPSNQAGRRFASGLGLGSGFAAQDR